MNLPQDIYCNPLALPDYPEGIACSCDQFGTDTFIGPRMDYRELADPELLYDDGVWYIFPSGHQAYVSRDLVHWAYCPIEIDDDLGYAPSIVRCKDRYYLTSSSLFRSPVSRMFTAPSPLGPYRNLGEIKDGRGQALPTEYLDPSLFCDDDGRLYLYWGYGPDGGGVFGLELDPDNPNRGIGSSQKLIDFDGVNEFEHFGEYHEHGDWGFLEGSAMFKHHGEYYLQYSGCGTVFRNYALGIYRGKGPLGPFTVQRTPLLHSPHGMVNGTGHGGMIAGPNETVWQFYTCLIRRKAVFERRIGMDRVTFDADGNARVVVTSTPQSVAAGDLGLRPISVNKPVLVSSCRDEHYGNFANDDCTHTWFAPAREDREPWWEVNLRQDFELAAVRILWAELNLDFKRGILPEPVRFKVEFFDAEHHLLPGAVNALDNATDRVVEFRAFGPIKARFVRLSWLAGRRMEFGLTQCTVFGYPRPNRTY